MDHKNRARAYLERLTDLIQTFDVSAYSKMVDMILDAYQRRAQIFVMGNGGSGATASHLVCDINKGCCFDLPRKFKMICLNDNIPTILALANDVAYGAVFEEQLKNFLNPGDLVIGISGSGNSENVLNAIAFAAREEAHTLGWCGFDGGRLARMVDLAFVAKSNDMQQVEDVHMILAHMLMQSLHQALHDGSCSAPARAAM
jgi:D-sedoheptulose 7-phosphate isomerase